MDSFRVNTKYYKFWILFLIVPVFVVLCSSIAHAGKKQSDKANQYIEEGLIFTRLNEHSKAIASYKKALEKDPENANIYYHLGNSYLWLNDYKKAKTEYNKALKINPNFSDARLQLAATDMRKADKLGKLGDNESVALEKLLVDEAVDICREIIERDKSYLKAYTKLAEIHLSQELLDDAISDYKDLLSIDNSNLESHIALAEIYLIKGDVDLSVKECKLILSDIEPDNLKTHFLLSSIYAKKGEHDEAIELLKQILEKKPNNINAHLQLGFLYLSLSKYDEAFAEAEQVFKIEPPETPLAAHFIKGCVMCTKKNYREAIPLLRKATVGMPDMVEAHYFLAQSLAGLGRTEEAISEFKSTLNLAPAFIPAKVHLARILSKTGGWEKETVRQCTEILEIKPDQIEALQLLGMVYIENKDFKNADLQFRKIYEINPLAGVINLAYLNLVSGHLSKCIRQCEEIIIANPDIIYAHSILANAHIKQGSFDKGIEQYKKVLELDPKSTSALINISNAYVVTEEYEKAKEALKNVISTDTSNLQSRLLLAGIYSEEGKIDEAAKFLEQVIEINPDYVNGYAVAGIYLLQGKTDESIDLCNKALKLIPDNAKLNVNLAIAYQQKESYDMSIKYCKRAIELKPEHPLFAILLANNYAAFDEYLLAKHQLESNPSFTNDQKEAYVELFGLCKLDNDKGKVITLALNRSIFARMLGFTDLAISECKKAVAIFPKNVVAKAMLANNYLSVNRNEDAIALHSEIIKEKPGFVSSYSDLARAYLIADKEDEAMDTFQDLIDVDSKSATGRLALATMLAKKGETDKAAKMIEGVIEIDTDNLMAHDLLGKVSLSKKDYERAETEFQKMIELSKDSFEGHFNMAKVKFTQGDFDTCIKHCSSALKSRSLDVRVLNILGMAYLKKGLPDKATMAFSKIIDIDSSFILAYLNLAKINIGNNRPDAAVRLCKDALKANPDSVEARVGLGSSYASIKKHSEAITEFETVIQKDPENINAHVFLARAHLASDDVVKAESAVIDALGIDPVNPMARYVLAEINLKKEEIQKAMFQLKQILPDNPKMLELYKLGILYIDVEDYDNAILTFKQGVASFPENYFLWSNLAIAYLMNKDFENAKSSCEKAIEIKQDNILLNLCMLNVHFSNGKYVRARSHLQRNINIGDMQKKMYFDLLKLCKQNKKISEKVSYHLSRSLAYSSFKWYKRVIRECEEIIKIVPANAVAYNMKADTLILSKENDKALEVCKKIVELEPENPVSYNKLAQIHRLRGETDEALSWYRKAISIDADNINTLLGIGILSIIKGMVEESAKAYQKVVELDSTSEITNNKTIWRAYNNLAFIYATKMDKKEKALELAERAKALEPDNPDVNDTLGWIYYLNTKYDKAAPLLRAAVRDEAIQNPSTHYHLGMAYYKNGLETQALSVLQQALKISNTFPEADDAKKVIDEIMESRVK